MAEIQVFDEPVAKARPRFARGRVFTPRSTELAEHNIRKAWIEAGHGTLVGPVSLRILIWVRRPDGHHNPPRKSDGVRSRSSAWSAVPCTRPDWENYAKTACDALNGVAYSDDARIVQALVSKRYADNGRTPGWTISVEEWKE